MTDNLYKCSFGRAGMVWLVTWYVAGKRKRDVSWYSADFLPFPRLLSLAPSLKMAPPTFRVGLRSLVKLLCLHRHAPKHAVRVIQNPVR